MNDFPDEHSWTVESRPSALSARAIFGSLLCMGAVGASVLCLLHTEMSGESRSQELEPTKQRSTAAPLLAASSTLTSTAESASASASASTSTLRAAVSSTPIPVATLALPPSTTNAPPRRPHPKSAPRVHVYPFPVPGPLASTAIPSEPAAEPPAEGTSGTNPYDEAPTPPTTQAAPATIGGAD